MPISFLVVNLYKSNNIDNILIKYTKKWKFIRKDRLNLILQR